MLSNASFFRALLIIGLSYECLFGNRQAEAFAPIPRAQFRPRTSPSSHSSPVTLELFGIVNAIETAGLLYDDTSRAFDAWEWTANLGAPAALVAGAVLVTLAETRESLAPLKADRNWIRVAKQLCRFLLLTSFGLEVSSIFVSTVTGSCLLSHGAQAAAKAIGYTSPLGLLHHHHEFEYLTIEIGFLQGLFHWLGAVALEILIPKENERLSARKMNGFMASCLVTLCLWILAFYNNQIPFYGDYSQMLRRYGLLFYRRFLASPRPMRFMYGPSALVSVVLGWRAFNSDPELDED